jgi:23S rRNA pseudouridine2605 synthase/16S rRNA pseudouridine516 synthase
VERLQKALAAAGVCSRRAAERLIETGRVRVNGRTVTRLGSRVDPRRDLIEVDGVPIASRPRRRVYLVLNKPRGYVTTLADPEGRPTVADLIRGVSQRVFPVGRLDYQSEGLLLVTNDGELARDLMHPRTGVATTYAVKVRGRPDDASLDRLADGVTLDGRRTRPSRLRLVKPGTNSWLQVTVVEGRKHLVRRMLQAIGHPVVKLRRIRYDGIRLGKLAPGRWRHLTPEEVARLQRALQRGRKTPCPSRPGSA